MSVMALHCAPVNTLSIWKYIAAVNLALKMAYLSQNLGGFPHRYHLGQDLTYGRISVSIYGHFTPGSPAANSGS
jgi:hypothetical protein